ncbi:glucose-dependent insulinotropic receptor-like [Microcaecilia unicolor]|uniref:Glucose-dependent insulinotropic receptor-like n=1 Tax=Microcaecilia unicolor TaxID=1415580 RepID=A0A6P7YWH4_9AMPH|nr:glucose-dependent insulinotropic receptor-like [Microcaecilia unicolor]XP_030071477.1 glucose-dependent insulinotropic receptor-like [Microcaecilia unicolor]
MDGISFGIILTVLSFFIVASNVVIAIALILLIQKNDSIGLYFVLNLSVADSLVGVAITGLVTEEFSKQFHSTQKFYCVLRMAFITSPTAASILTMVLVAFDRYLAIKKPFMYFRVMTGSMVAVCIIGLWITSGVFGFLPLIIQEFQQQDYNGCCSFFTVFQPTYLLTILCVGFVPGLFIFTYFYCDILKIAHLHAQQIWDMGHIGSAINYPHPRYTQDIKAVRTVAVLIGCFVLSWLPFFIVTIVQAACQACVLYNVIEKYLWLLGLCNSLLNPLIYAYWQKEVRLQIYQMWFCVKRRIFLLFIVENYLQVSRRTHIDAISHL